MTLLLNALGAKTTYEQVMGLTGSCYRASMAYGWDPGSTIVNITYWHQFVKTGKAVPDNNASLSYGIDYTNIYDHSFKENDKDACEKLVQDSIKSGIPVLSLGGRFAPEWSIVLGYEISTEGTKYFGRSFFDENANENELFTDNRYVLADRFPAECVHVYTKPCEPISPINALKISLETCLNMFKPHERFGYGAYERMVKSFENNEFKCDWSDTGDIDTIFICLTDARKAAFKYLLENANLLSGENKNDLLKVSSLYKNMYNILQGVLDDKDFDGNIISQSENVRTKIIGELHTLVKLERNAHVIIGNILNNW
jgi:hypothetical protein